MSQTKQILDPLIQMAVQRGRSQAVKVSYRQSMLCRRYITTNYNHITADSKISVRFKRPSGADEIGWLWLELVKPEHEI